LLEATLKELKQVVTSEKKGAYTGAGVLGGFATYLQDRCQVLRSEGCWSPAQLKAIDELVRLSAAYRYSDYNSREEILARISALLEKLAVSPENAEPDHPFGNDFFRQGIEQVRGIGPKRRQQLQRLGIETIYDLLYYLPKRYADRTSLKKFNRLNIDCVETLQVAVRSVELLKLRKGLTIVKALVYDGESYGFAVWFNQSYLKTKLRPGVEIIITGKPRLHRGCWEINVSEFTIINNREDDPVHTARIVPIYAVTEGLTQRTLRQIIYRTLEELPDDCEILPCSLREKYRFMDLHQALWQVHFPGSWPELTKARQRLVYEELFLLQVAMSQRAARVKRRQGIAHIHEGRLWQDFLAGLPFTFTRAQRRVINEIRQDMNRSQPMTRLLQGDVGSGKTVVAAAAAVKAVANGYQVALMAPTEILARQHYRSVTSLFSPLSINVALVSGSMSEKEKERVLGGILSGQVQVVVGTHALIQEKVQFKNLGLAIVDEQHRFGVLQRDSLLSKGQNADLLVMTATPIPRTLSLTLYGDLQVSVIDELPPGRQRVITRWVGVERRGRVLDFLDREMAAGRQVYVVCPLVAESEKLDLAAAEETARNLAKRFPRFNIGLVHGKMKAGEKEKNMQGFYRGEINLLVSTTVIEVGVDVPNASVMLVEGAERFGLAQLHQLRGRIGRGRHRSYCILMGQPKTGVAKERLKVMEETDDGFVIAEEDLRLRGPGEFFGTRQHGLPEFKVVDLLRDGPVIPRAAADAQQFVQTITEQQLKYFSQLIKFRFGTLKIS